MIFFLYGKTESVEHHESTANMLIFIKNISDVEIEPVIEYHKKKLSLRIFGTQSRFQLKRNLENSLIWLILKEI